MPSTHEASVVFITGSSGAGRTTAGNILEDIGFETIDNLPLALLPRLLTAPLDRNIALSVDVRTRDFSVKALLDAIDMTAQMEGVKPTLLYLDCSLDVLINRFSATKRRHPLAPEGAPAEGIREEIALLDTLKGRADILIDTSDLSPHELRAELTGMFDDIAHGSLAVNLHSFSYKRGVPRGIDMVLDCRFLKNPYWDESLRDQNGLDKGVRDYVTSDALYEPFFDRLADMVEFLLPAYQAEGKAHFSVGLGCTGGQHRSVCVTEELATALRKLGWRVNTRHREIERRK